MVDLLEKAVKTITTKSDGKKTISEIIRSYKFPFERHYYETEDGNINKVIRISGILCFLFS